MKNKQWWSIAVHTGRHISAGNYIGQCYATYDEIKKALGPWCRIEGNSVRVFGKPTTTSVTHTT